VDVKDFATVLASLLASFYEIFYFKILEGIT